MRITERIKTKHRTYYGEYSATLALPDWDIYRLRHAVLIRHSGFSDFCTGPDADKMEVRFLPTDAEEIHAFLKRHEKDYFMICMLLYGNIHRHTFKESELWYRNAFMNYQRIGFAWRCRELSPGEVAEPGRLTFSVDPSLTRKEAVRLFEKFLTKRRKAVSATAKPDPFRGYFGISEKRFNPSVVKRYLAVFDLREKHPKTWQKKAASAFAAAYPQDPESRRRTINRDLENARRIIEWAIRGRFPCAQKLEG